MFRFRWVKYSAALMSLSLLAGCASQLNFQELNGPTGTKSYAMPVQGNDLVGKVYQVKAKPGDTLAKLAQKYDLGAQELIDANKSIRPNRIHVGAKIIIPTEYILPPVEYRKGIVINIAEMRLFYFDKADNTVMTFPVAVGRQGWNTPLGKTYVYRKQEAPTWNVPKSIREEYLLKTGEEHPRRIEAGPKNPLGDYAIYLHMDGYLIHGTNNPASIGRRVSSGCIRMYNQDVAKLYQYVHRGTPVNIIYYPAKAGWHDHKLYLEAHTQLGTKAHAATVQDAINSALEEQPGVVNWSEVKKVVRAHTGIPTQVGGSS